jgi:hypothetical protein
MKAVKRTRPAPIEFIAPYRLEECVFQLRDARSLEIVATFQRQDAGTYKCKVWRPRRDRSGRDVAMVEANLYLRAISERETAVVGSFRFAWSIVFGTLIFTALLIFAIVWREWVLFVIVALVTLSSWAFVWWDRQTLVSVVKRRLRPP